MVLYPALVMAGRGRRSRIPAAVAMAANAMSPTPKPRIGTSRYGIGGVHTSVSPGHRAHT